MPRYLTPTKICLLILVELYAADDIPAVARLDVLSLIASHINPPSEYDTASLDDRSKVPSSDITSFSETLSQWPSGIPGRTLNDILLRRVWEFQTLDSLHELFNGVTRNLAPSNPETPEAAAVRISRSSPLGQFIRRCNVEFTRLQFSESQALCTALSAYRAPSYQPWASRNPEAARQLLADQPAWATTPSSSFSTSDQDQSAAVQINTSVDDTSTILSLSIHQLQKLGTRVPPSLKRHLSTWINDIYDSSAQSLQHFLQFFECWRAGQYEGALEGLHRYFDYSLVARGADGGALPQGASGGVGGGMRTYYQYALLHLSVLHADFERWGECVDALGECIGTARENNDPTCLNFALSYLLYLRQAHTNTSNAATSLSNLSRLVGGGSNDQDEIHFLKTKAREGRNWALLSQTLMEEGRGEMTRGGSVSKALECILQSEWLDMQHDLRTMMPSGALFRGAGFQRLGQSSLGSRMYESVSLVHSGHCPLPEGIRTACRIAHDLAAGGNFDEATNMLRTAKDELSGGVLKLEQRVVIFEMLILLKKSVHAESFGSADHHLQQLRPARTLDDMEITFQITLLEIELLLKKQDYQTALQIANKNLKQLKQNPRSDIAHTLTFLTLKARIFAAASEPAKGLSISIRAASTAQRLMLVKVMIEAVTVLSAILIALGEFEAARGLLGAALPHALESSDAHLTARLFAILADATVGTAGHECKPGSSDQKKVMRMAAGYIGRSYTAYARLNDLSGLLHCLIMQATIARWDNDEATATHSEEKYIQLLADRTAEVGVVG